jgi:hypothetical protein
MLFLPGTVAWDNCVVRILLPLDLEMEDGPVMHDLTGVSSRSRDAASLGVAVFSGMLGVTLFLD